jgi:hypothetical protein
MTQETMKWTLEDYQFRAFIEVLIKAGKTSKEITEMAESIENKKAATEADFYSECNVEWIKKGMAQHERGEGIVYHDVNQIIADRQ